jgi:hypothetical protein
MLQFQKLDVSRWYPRREEYIVQSTLRTRTALWFVAGLMAWHLVLPRARACSPQTCSVATVFPSGGELPLNLLTLRFKPPRNYYEDGGLSTPRLYRVDGGARTELALTHTALSDGNVLLSPVSPPEVGTRLTLETEQGCSAPGLVRADYVVTSAVAVPAELGSLQATLGRAAMMVPTSRGSCTVTLDAAYADLSVLYTDAARPLADVLEPQLWVDGKPYSWSARQVFATCEKYDEYPTVNLTLGKHRAEMRGTLLDGTMLKTAEIELDLRCVGPTSTLDGGTSRHDTSSGCSAVARPPALGMMGLLCLLPGVALMLRRRRPDRVRS